MSEYTENKVNTLPTEHIEWIDTLRVMTMILVIIGHSTYNVIYTRYGGIYYFASDEICTMQRVLTGIVDFIYSFHMPLFMAISGACLSLGYNKTSDKRAFLSGKARRLLLPFILTTCLLSIPVKYMAGYYDNSDNVIHDAFWGQVLLFGNSHLWFVVSLFICFAVFIVIEPFMSKHPRRMWTLLVLMTMGSFMIYGKINDGLGIHGFTKHLLYFALGFYSIRWLCDFMLPKGVIVISVILNILFPWFIPYFISILSIFIGRNLAGYSIQIFSILLAIWGCINMTLICKLITLNCDKILQNPLYGFLKKHSYSLYLYSDPINYIFIALFFSVEGFDIYHTPSHSLLAFAIRSIGSILFATLMILVVNYFKKIGEIFQPKAILTKKS